MSTYFEWVGNIEHAIFELDLEWSLPISPKYNCKSILFQTSYQYWEISILNCLGIIIYWSTVYWQIAVFNNQADAYHVMFCCIKNSAFSSKDV